MNTHTIPNTQPQPQPRRRKRLTATDWAVLCGLLLLCLVPSLAGTVRVVELSSNPAVTPDNARFVSAPIPVIAHIVSSVLYTVLGAFQFIRGARRWKPGLHKKLGLYLLLPAGMVSALSGLWMTLTYPWPDGDGVALYVMRLIVGIVMVFALVMGYRSFQRREYKVHGAWMLRAYAIGIGAGTQVLTHIPWFILHGAATPDEGIRAVMMGAGWLINMVLAEWVIQTRMQRPTARPVS
jgi:uncharacterized membrane protein